MARVVGSGASVWEVAVSNRGLVLGGGGPVGFAWYAGLARGLAEEGVDLREADVVVGTSAGAQAGAWIAGGCELTELVEVARSIGDAHAGENFADGVDFDLVLEVYGLLSGLDRPASPEVSAKIGELAKRVPSRDGDPNYVRERAGRWVPDILWPTTFRAVVVAADTGQVRLLIDQDRIDLARGVAASCAAPGIITPVLIEGEPFMDGGARSPTNADLLLDLSADTALVVTPVPRDTPIIGDATYRMLDAEVGSLEANGVDVTVIRPTEREAAAFGFDLLNTGRVREAIDAGVATGSAVADQLRRW